MRNKGVGQLLIILCISVLFSSCKGREKLLVSGCGWNQVAIIDKQTGTMEWKHPLQKGEDCNDVELTKEGCVLYAYTSGARLVNRKQEIIWDYKVKETEELYTATQLLSGGYMLAVCGNPSRIIELDSDGAVINELEFVTGIVNIHDQFRQIVKTKQNTYLIPLMGKGEVIEMNGSKEIVNRIECGGNPFSIQVLDNGNWLVACGDAHGFVEIDPIQRKIVKKVDDTDVHGISLLFVAELVRYGNGNTLICNWNGHSKDKKKPLLIEIDAKNEVVWKLPIHPDITNISTVCSFSE